MAAPLPSREEILACLRAQTKPLHAGDIAKRCGVAKRSFPQFVELLEQLASQRSVRRVGRSRYAFPQRAKEAASWIGILSVNARGFGFVNASGKPDVFVPAPALGPAMHGDTVKIEVRAETPRGTEGQVVSVERRRDPRVAGTLRRTRKSAWLEPDDPRVRGPILIAEGVELCRDGDAAVVEITRFPETAGENPEARVAEILGKSGDAQVEVAKILVREQVQEAHPEAAMAEAERLAMKARKLDLGSREDLRAIPFLTIDPVDARDHDDAVYVERTRQGFRAYVAIADVSEYVQPNTALDAEARARGCTIYLPDRAVPMLPGVLAADVCSLLPDCERYCLCVIAELDARARVSEFRVVEGLMRAAAMVSYDSAARALGFSDKPPPSPLAEAFKKPLKALSMLAERLRRARLDRGALDLDLPEAKLVIDEETGVPLEVRQQKSDPGIKRAYQLVEEMMLLANELVASWLGKRHCPAVYRVHGKPDEQKLERLGNAAVALGAPFDFETMREPVGVSRWLESIRSHAAREVLEGLLLRSLKQAVYDTVNIGHFGLASVSYVHFTSPIRRYPDLLVHRAVKQLLRGGTPDLTPSAIEKLREGATHSSFRERAAMQVEREVVDLYRALFMRDKLGEVYEGRVTALLGSGVIVAVTDPYVEMLVTFESLGPDRYEIADDELSYVGQRSGEVIALGETMVVEVVDVSLARRTVYGARVVSAAPSRPGQRRTTRDRTGRGRTGRGEKDRGQTGRSGTKSGSTGDANARQGQSGRRRPARDEAKRGQDGTKRGQRKKR